MNEKADGRNKFPSICALIDIRINKFSLRREEMNCRTGIDVKSSNLLAIFRYNSNLIFQLNIDFVSIRIRQLRELEFRTEAGVDCLNCFFFLLLIVRCLFFILPYIQIKF